MRREIASDSAMRNAVICYIVAHASPAGTKRPEELAAKETRAPAVTR